MKNFNSEAFERQADSIKQIKTWQDKAIKNLITITRNTVQNGFKADKTKLENSLEDLLKARIEIDATLQTCTNAHKTLQTEFNVDMTEKEINKIFDDAVVEPNFRKIRSDQSFRELETIFSTAATHAKEKRTNESVSEERSSSSQELIITKEPTEYIDQFTKKPIVNPIRNVNCKHVYEKDTILEHMRKHKGKTKCPTPGCAIILKRNDLEELD